MSDTDLLRAYVNSTSVSDEPFLASCWEEAGELVDAYVGGTIVTESITERAQLEVAAELFHRRQAPGGITQYATMDGASPVRMARDPMLGAYPLLDRYVSAGLA